MNDMTKGPVAGHVVRLASFIAVSTLFQSLYFLADLYFVGRLGKEAVAGVSLAGTVMFMVLALTQSLGVGATSLVAQALGRKDRDHAERVFNQALVLSCATGLVFGVVFFTLRDAYLEWLAADAATAVQGEQYLVWFIPALFLQFPMVAMGAALRGMGDMKIPTLIQIGTVVLNIALAPTLMFGWVTGHPLGVAGTAIASLLAVATGCVALSLYFGRPSSPMKFRPDQWDPDFRLVAGHAAHRRPRGRRVRSDVHLRRPRVRHHPAVRGRRSGRLRRWRAADAGPLPPHRGHRHGHGSRGRAELRGPARRPGARGLPRRGGHVLRVIMVILTLLCHIAPEALVRIFNGDPQVVAYGAEYLRVISWNFLASGLVFVSSSVFQGMGNTLPSLATSALRLVLFAVPAYVLSHRPGFQLVHVWQIGVAAVTIQFVVNMVLLHREFGRRLAFT
jgi:Na+-driven multidrug efflux pump